MSEAKACPTCGSLSRSTFVKWSGPLSAGSACTFNKHDPWHDAPPQPAPCTCPCHHDRQAMTKHSCCDDVLWPVQPAPAGFEEALDEFDKGVSDNPNTSTTGNLGRIYCVCGGTPTIIEGVLRCSNCLRKME